MQGKVVVITGATSGIGRSPPSGSPRRARGWCWSPATTPRPALKRLNAIAAHPGASLLRGRSLAPVRDEAHRGGDRPGRAAHRRADQQRRRLVRHRRVTEDGLELTFALNHMSYFVLTCALMDRLKAAAPSRVVNTASGAHRGATLDFDDLQTYRDYDGFKAYGRSKLCNILFTRELARRLAGSGVTANCLHPGFVATRFGDQPAAGVRSPSALPSSLRYRRKRARRPSSISPHRRRSPARAVSISTRMPRTHRRPRLRMMPSPTGSGRNRPGSRRSTSRRGSGRCLIFADGAEWLEPKAAELEAEGFEARFAAGPDVWSKTGNEP